LLIWKSTDLSVLFFFVLKKYFVLRDKWLFRGEKVTKMPSRTKVLEISFCFG